MDDVNARGRLEEGSMCARNIRRPQRRRVETNSGLTYGANDEAKFGEVIVVEGTAGQGTSPPTSFGRLTEEV